jgi:hypothetical protein
LGHGFSFLVISDFWRQPLPANQNKMMEEKQLDDGIAHTFVSTALSSRLRRAAFCPSS